MGIIEAVQEVAREEGEHEKALKIALRMKKAGYPLREIAQLTELSEKDIQALGAEADPG